MGRLLNREYTTILGNINAILPQESDRMVVGDHGLRTSIERSKFLIELCQRKIITQSEKYTRESPRKIATCTSWITMLYKAVRKTT